MDLIAQKIQFYKDVLPAKPNEWEVDEVFDLLSGLSNADLGILLSHVHSIWPISQSLCFSYLAEGTRVMDRVPPRHLPEWVRQLISMYESKGLVGARLFMSDIEKHFLLPLQGELGVCFEEVSGVMLPYIRGISGEDIDIKIGPVPSTDTSTIFLPQVIDVFGKQQENRFFYKMLATLQWSHAASGAFSEIVGSEGRVVDPLLGLSDRQLAMDLFAIRQLGRSLKFLAHELPGVVRRGLRLCLQLIHEIQPGGEATQRCKEIKQRMEFALYFESLDFETPHQPGEFVLEDSYPFDVVSVYKQISALPGSYILGAAELLLGEFDFDRAGGIIRLRRAEQKKQFVTLLATLLTETLESDEGAPDKEDFAESLKDTALMMLQDAGDIKERENKPAIHLDNEGLELPVELSNLLQDIEKDLGTLPLAYVQAAAGLAGKGIQSNDRSTGGIEAPVEVRSITHSYDEWDYRRGGYRDKWCSLYVKELKPVVSTFVETTLVKYKPQLTRLRRQFELLRTRERFIRRRRHGDDIDLDAMIEALGDAQAGLCPTDRLFVRLLRDVRDISTLFLVDMSNSTEGWVGLAIKEALVLLTESLEMAGDRYGIYGFSGMRRSKSELFHVKNLDEAYGVNIQQRIAAMMPQEYTRMGPPIRHLTKLLLETQSKVRLLVVITDGKPEDYDDYKGQYAIEDTKKALVEARGSGVHPFCITIDRSAHEYLAHMFGIGNYIYVDNVNSLPARMSEMYRLLTH